jgi:hypothetical protein
MASYFKDKVVLLQAELTGGKALVEELLKQGPK